MKVLHIWNTAGVASILAKYQYRFLGWKTWVLMRKKYDTYGLTVYGSSLNIPAFLFKILSTIASRFYDIIHIHSLDELVPYIKSYCPKAKIVLHYHGSDIRNKWHKKNYFKYADIVLVSTPDLLKNSPRGVLYLPNPVDIELFRPFGPKEKIRPYSSTVIKI